MEGLAAPGDEDEFALSYYPPSWLARAGDEALALFAAFMALAKAGKLDRWLL